MRYLFALSLALLLCANLATNQVQAQFFEKLRDGFLGRRPPTTTDKVVSGAIITLLATSHIYFLRRGRQWFFLHREFPVFQTQTVLDREQIRTEVAKLTGLVWRASKRSNEDLFFNPQNNNTLQIKYKRRNRYRIRWVYAVDKETDPMLASGGIFSKYFLARRPREFRHPKRNPRLIKVRDFLLSLDSVNLALQPRQKP